MMLKKDGLEFCDSLKNDFRISYIFILLFIVKVDDFFCIEGLKRGVDVYISKLFKVEELKICLEQ